MSHPLERTTSNSSVATVTPGAERDREPTNTGGAKTLRYQNTSYQSSHPRNGGLREYQTSHGSGPQGGRAEQTPQHGAYPPTGHAFGQAQQPGNNTSNGKHAPSQPPGTQQNPQNAPSNQSNASNASTAATAGSQQQPWGGPFPSLHLWPLNETFIMKMIHLPPNERIKIGRQTNAKTQPGERNGYFDSKVLSRMHAEVWQHDGKIFIKDVKSSNGTFVNGDRLSAEGVESEPFELKSEDMVEFGIDIISEDNKTIVHHKVSAKAYCVFDVDDAGLSARQVARARTKELSQYYPHDPRTSMGPQRRNGNQGPLQQGVAPGGQPLGMNMMSAGGKAAGLNFDHVLHRLQTELQKSKETGSELQGLTGAMTEIQDTLSGNVPPNENGTANQFIPPQFRPLPETGIPDAAMGNTSATIAALQAQLSSTQSILVSHKDRIRALETLLSEQEAIKDEVLGIRQQLEESKREYEGLLKESRESFVNGQVQADEKSKTAPEQGKAASPESDTDPTAMEYEGDITDGIMDDFEDARSSSSDSRAKAPPPPPPATLDTEAAHLRQEELIAQNTALSLRLDALSSELERALELSRSLQSQHAEATSTVRALEERVQSLEKDMARRVTEASEAGKAAEDKWEAWKSRFEQDWRKEREGWDLERERLRGVVREWEEASRRAQEEEEERRMNGRMGGDDDDDDEGNSDERDSGDEGPSDRSRDGGGGRKRVSGSRLRTGALSGTDSGAAVDSDDDDIAPRSPSRKSSHPVSPGSTSRPESSRHSRRESSCRLDPAIRALRATAGNIPEQQRTSGHRDNRTPRTGSPSAADGALESLRAKAGRPRRVDTIKGRKKRTQTLTVGVADDAGASSLASHTSPVRAKSAATITTTTKTTTDDKDDTHALSRRTRDDVRGSDGNNTSTESDETAHGGTRQSRVKAEDEPATISAGPTEVKGPLNAYPATLAMSVAFIAIVGYAYMYKVKE
ncbi:hypothetical protein NliqN6_3656 [Naganishia liquefaciens]|uniref:FHA domain-containing protein n=1 Tax=Naganishia liquefaciens TaxID=104408 RepID=A0A8H3TUF6_9TREE|nr:hypothetical protein NliqN6_3656 [Naganishia liquefaciens]